MPDYQQIHYELTRIVSDDVIAEGRQFTMDTHAALAEWSGGDVQTRDSATVFVIPAGAVSPEATAQLGDYVMHRGVEWWVEPASGFTQRWATGSAAPSSETLFAPFTLELGDSPWQ